MHAANDSDRAGIVIPLWTSASTDTGPTPRFASSAKVRVLPKHEEEGIEGGIAAGLARERVLAWFWEDAVLALLGSSGLGAIFIALRLLV